jgi:GntR family transcriptional regulator
MESLADQPLYVQAYQSIAALIDSGNLQPGDPLPAEPALARKLEISRSTLRRALRRLEEEGLIVRRHGIGTFVSTRPHLTSGLERLESVLSMAAREGLTSEVRNYSVETVEAGPVLAERLRIAPGTELTRVRRTILLDRRPAAYFEDFVVPELLQPCELTDTFSGSILDLLREHYPGRLTRAKTIVNAVPAESPVAERLTVDRGRPLLLLEETLFDEQDAVEFSMNYFVPAMFRFHIIRRQPKEKAL